MKWESIRIHSSTQMTENSAQNKKKHLRGMEYGAVNTILVSVQLLNEITLFAFASSSIKNVCCRVCASCGSNKHLVPHNAAVNKGIFF
jgi:hypothetical protein